MHSLTVIIYRGQHNNAGYIKLIHACLYVDFYKEQLTGKIIKKNTGMMRTEHGICVSVNVNTTTTTRST